MLIQPTQITSVIVKGCLVRLLAEPSDDRILPMTHNFDAKSLLIPNLYLDAIMQFLRFHSIGSPSALLYTSSFWVNHLDPPTG